MIIIKLQPVSIGLELDDNHHAFDEGQTFVEPDNDRRLHSFLGFSDYYLAPFFGGVMHDAVSDCVMHYASRHIG